MTTTGNKKQNKGVLGPSSRDKIYTVQENKLLDQITMELIEAWTKDLRKIKQAFETNGKLSDLFKEMYCDLKREKGKVDDFIEACQKLVSFEKIHESQRETHMLINDMRNELLGLSRRLEYKPVKDLLDKTQGLDVWMRNLDNWVITSSKTLHRLEEAVSQMTVKKKWWQFWA